MEQDQIKGSLPIKYVSARGYRAVHASGGYGGTLPTGEIFFGFYSERPNFPDGSSIEVRKSVDGVSAEEKLEVERGLVREIEFGVTMSVQVAKSVKQWLEDHIHAVESAGDRGELKIVPVSGGKGPIV